MTVIELKLKKALVHSWLDQRKYEHYHWHLIDGLWKGLWKEQRERERKKKSSLDTKRHPCRKTNCPRIRGKERIPRYYWVFEGACSKVGGSSVDENSSPRNYGHHRQVHRGEWLLFLTLSLWVERWNDWTLGWLHLSFGIEYLLHPLGVVPLTQNWFGAALIVE